MGRNFISPSKLPRRGDIPKITFKLFGDWDGAIRSLNKLSPIIKECSLKAQLKLCKEIRDKVKAHLVNQDLGWPKLSKRYSQRKGQKGLDGRTLISYAEYYHSIQTWQVGNQHLTMVGVKSGIYTRTLSGRKSKLQVAQIAAIHEFSRGKRIPRRPLWNPTIREMGGVKGLKAMFIKHLFNNMRRNGVQISKIGNPF